MRDEETRWFPLGCSIGTLIGLGCSFAPSPYGYVIAGILAVSGLVMYITISEKTRKY